MSNNTIICPHCNSDGNRLIIQLHWTKKYHSFICGNCRLEMDFISSRTIPLNYYLRQIYNSTIEYETMEMKEKINRMTPEQMEARLEVLNRKLKK